MKAADREKKEMTAGAVQQYILPKPNRLNIKYGYGDHWFIKSVHTFFHA